MAVIPPEIIGLITSRLSKKDMANMRLTSRSFKLATTKHLFSEVILRPESRSMRVFKKVANNPTLAIHVQNVRLVGAEKPKPYPYYLFNDMEPLPAEIQIKFKERVALIRQFRNVVGVELHFQGKDSPPIEPDHGFGGFGGFGDGETFQPFKWGPEILRLLFDALNDAEHPTPRLKSLDLQILYDRAYQTVTTGENFMEVMGRITQLRLHIIKPTGSIHPLLRIHSTASMNIILRPIFKTWVQPGCDSLTSLTLHCDDFFSDPKAKLPFNLPNLQHLEIGNHHPKV
jgi:hypothetical protein